jgi:hypothetical protein
MYKVWDKGVYPKIPGIGQGTLSNVYESDGKYHKISN